MEGGTCDVLRKSSIEKPIIFFLFYILEGAFCGLFGTWGGRFTGKKAQIPPQTIHVCVMSHERIELTREPRASHW